MQTKKVGKKNSKKSSKKVGKKKSKKVIKKNSKKVGNNISKKQKGGGKKLKLTIKEFETGKNIRDNILEIDDQQSGNDLYDEICKLFNKENCRGYITNTFTLYKSKDLSGIIATGFGSPPHLTHYFKGTKAINYFDVYIKMN
jgi:hypothetical protein